MSDQKTNYVYEYSGWLLPLFIAAKLAGPCSAWSWWWLFFPGIPVLTEIIKYLMVR